jgi:hypothetical protein
MFQIQLKHTQNIHSYAVRGAISKAIYTAPNMTYILRAISTKAACGVAVDNSAIVGKLVCVAYNLIY